MVKGGLLLAVKMTIVLTLGATFGGWEGLVRPI